MISDNLFILLLLTTFYGGGGGKRLNQYIKLHKLIFFTTNTLFFPAYFLIDLLYIFPKK